jgi:hypothetical protein
MRRNLEKPKAKHFSFDDLKAAIATGEKALREGFGVLRISGGQTSMRLACASLLICPSMAPLCILGTRGSFTLALNRLSCRVDLFLNTLFLFNSENDSGVMNRLKNIFQRIIESRSKNY